MNLRGPFKSTRFILIQESLFLAFISCLLSATIIKAFPIEAFLLFLGPVAVGVYGIKSWAHTQDTTGQGSSADEHYPNEL